MADLLNHHHCRMCNRAVRFGDETCGTDCAKEYTALKKKRARTVLWFYAGGAFLMIILVLQLTGRFQ